MASDNVKAMPSSSKNPSSTRGSKNVNNKAKGSGNIPSTGTTTSVAPLKMSTPASLLNGNTKLSSLVPARDLTLGGRGAIANSTRKVFVPNLNVVRNKNNAVKTSKDTTTTRGRGRGRGCDRGSAHGRGSNRAGASLIQTTGVFSEGAGDINVRKSINSSSYQRNTEDSPAALRKPTITKAERKVDLKDVMAKDHDILRNLDEDDVVEMAFDGAEDKTDFHMLPIKLSEAKWKCVKFEIKQESAKNEDALGVANQIHALQVTPQAVADQSSVPRYPQNIEEMLSNSQQQIFLMQLPDNLPCVEEDEPSVATKEDVATLSESSKTKPPLIPHVLKKLEEGQVGRLLRYKSGKCKLVLGETYFDLNMGMETGFWQDLMSVTTNREERSGNMINLGPIHAKLTATPDWEYLLKKKTLLPDKL